jgi:hypothetical protein
MSSDHLLFMIIKNLGSFDFNVNISEIVKPDAESDQLRRGDNIAV